MGLFRAARRLLLLVIAAIMLLLAYAFFWAPPGPRTLRAFDPDRTAALELSMWQAYYERRNVRLFTDLVTLGHEQYRVSMGEGDDRRLLPGAGGGDFREDAIGLRAGPARPRACLHDCQGLDGRGLRSAGPWLAPSSPGGWRGECPARTPPSRSGSSSPTKMPCSTRCRASGCSRRRVLRARAGKLRDDGGERADWAEVARLLQQSYRALHAGVQR